MHLQGRLWLTLSVVAAGLVIPSVASATTYCVHKPATSCAAGQTDEAGDLQAALTAAQAADGNSVVIGPGTFSAGIYQFNAGAERVAITGAGVGQTILKAPAGQQDVLRLVAAAGSSLSGATIATTGTAQTGLSASGVAADHVDVEMDAGSAQYGVVLTGSSLTDSVVNAAPPIASAATVDALNDSTLTRDHLSGFTGVSVAGGNVTAHDLVVRFLFTGAEAVAASAALTIDNSVIVALPSAANQIGLLSESGASLAAQSDTVVGNGASPTGVDVDAIGSATSASVQNSIITGFAHATGRQSSGPSANLTLSHDDVHLNADSGVAGTYAPNAGTDIDVDPLFLDPANQDYHLRAGSPAIDAGNACQTTCQTIPDLDGLTRPIDGNGDGTATRDLGSYEYGHRAPVATATADRATAAPGEGAAFSATASDPDPGDALTLTWAFDDGATATGLTASHAFTTPGVHTATFTTTDPTGLTAASSVTVTVTAPPGPVVTPIATPVTPVVLPVAAKDVTRPTLTKLALKPAAFAVGAAATATTARVARTKAPPKGTTIAFTLSETATVTLKIERATTSAACVKRAKAKHRSAKACTTYRVKGTLTRKGLKQGAQKVAFSGRIGHSALARGSYRLTASATDAAGNRTKADAHAMFTVL